MKIGILTFHCAHNYGAVLQAYALQEKIKSLGHDVEIIDYTPLNLISPYKIFSWNFFFTKGIKGKIKYILSIFLNFKNKFIRKNKFDTFISTYLKLSKINYNHYNKLKKVNDYEIIVVGSDQIWNNSITKNIDKAFFGIIENRDNLKKVISYAASMKNDNITEYNKLVYIDYLNNIDTISVRENDIKVLLSKLLKRPIELTIDPTLLLESAIWDKLAVSNSKKMEKYVLVYQVGFNKNTILIAQHIAKQIGATVLEIESSISVIHRKHKIQTASPQEFLGYIKNASCIITTSFHATVFSIIFKKPFYTIALNSSSDNRSFSLLHSLNLEHRMINFLEKPKFEEIDYSNINDLLKEIRINSENFLITTLS